MKIIATYDFEIPDFLICPWYNDDTSGLEESDFESLEEMQACFNSLVKDNKGSHCTLELISEEPYFTHSPDFCNLACDVYESKLHIFA